MGSILTLDYLYWQKKEDIISFLFVVDKMASFTLIGWFFACGNVFEIGYYLCGFIIDFGKYFKKVL